MASYHFPGFPEYLEAAAARIGRPEAAGPARRIATLAALANLCAQLVAAEEAHIPGILAKAEEFRDQLLAAYQAAEQMLVDVRAARGPSPAPGPRGSRRGVGATDRGGSR